ncbi:MAG: hypothetical protein HKL88_06055 [Bacteroidia bacterium]|nr:hypothetical protein [Bacteroidia bacterium]
MGNLFFISALAFPLIFSPVTSGDGTCNGYFPVKQGTTYEISNYSPADKLTGTSKCTIEGVANAGDTTILSMLGNWYDTKGVQIFSTHFKVKCTGGLVLLNMEDMGLLDPKQTFTQKGSVTMRGDYLDIPGKPAPGEKLKNGKLIISLDGGRKKDTNRWVITSKLCNRRMEKKETVTTPAGTFSCIKITYDVSTYTIFDVKSHVAEWYALNTGMVRSERYSEDGQLQGYSVLTSISGN